jgi:hypothetical protein
MLAPAAAAAEVCQPKILRPPVLKLIKPLMELRIKQTQDELTEDGRWKGESPRTPEIEKRFESILSNRTKVGDEAVAYLLNVYMGEHPGEELVCEVTNRGKRMLPLIAAYAECTPLTGLEPLPQFVRGSGGTRMLAEGK